MKTILKFIAVLLLLFISLYPFAAKIFTSRSFRTSILSPLTTLAKKADVLGVFTHADPLAEVVDQVLHDGPEGTYSIVIKNLKTGESYSTNEHVNMQPASLYKLWVMATVYNQERDGILSDDDVLSSSINRLNREFGIDSDTPQSDDPEESDNPPEDIGVQATVQEALEKMITISDNTSALLLSDKVKYTNVTKLLQEYGLTESKLGSPPQTTAADIAKYYQLIYDRKLVSPAFSQKMLDVLVKQRLNDRIPKYLPDNIYVAHKTGEIDYFKHDGGIVFAKKNYIIVVMTQTDSPKDAAEKTAELSKAVYDYFQKQD